MPGHEVFTLKITSLAHDGRGIGFVESAGQGRGLAVFVANALPGEIIRCQLSKRARNYLEGQKLATLTTTFTPEQPHCAHGQACGACPLQPLPYPSQLFWKETLLKDSMLRVGKFAEGQLNDCWQGLAPAPLLRGFRNKITLAFGKTETGAAALGMRRRNSHLVTPIKACALIDSSAQAIIANCEKLALASNLPVYAGDGFWRFVTLRRARTLDSPANRWNALILTSPGTSQERQKAQKLAEQLLELQPQLLSVSHWERKAKDLLATGQKRVFGSSKSAHATLALEAGGELFGINDNSFFQVNDSAASLLVEKIRQLDSATAGPLLDLYCGVGAPGQLLAKQHDSCLGMEIDQNAIKYARSNASLHGLSHWRYQACDVPTALAAFAPQDLRKFVTILLDPPRSGLGNETTQKITELRAEKLLYISCNPVTFARDSLILKSKFQLQRLAAVDMFPHTPHLECCSLWSRVK